LVQYTTHHGHGNYNGSVQLGRTRLGRKKVKLIKIPARIRIKQFYFHRRLIMRPLRSLSKVHPILLNKTSYPRYLEPPGNVVKSVVKIPR
jgi:hypothetical protein